MSSQSETDITLGNEPVIKHRLHATTTTKPNALVGLVTSKQDLSVMLTSVEIKIQLRSNFVPTRTD